MFNLPFNNHKEYIFYYYYLLFCRDEQYRQLWNELESLVRSNSDLSSQHEKVLGCLLECKKPSNLSEDPRTSPRQPSDSTEALDDHSQGLTDPSLHELNKYVLWIKNIQQSNYCLE